MGRGSGLGSRLSPGVARSLVDVSVAGCHPLRAGALVDGPEAEVYDVGA